MNLATTHTKQTICLIAKIFAFASWKVASQPRKISVEQVVQTDYTDVVIEAQTHEILTEVRSKDIELIGKAP